MNKLARAVTKWTKACNKRLARLISYIHHTTEYRQFVVWETQDNNADLDCFKTLLQETLKTKSTSGGWSCVFSEVTCLRKYFGSIWENRHFFFDHVYFGCTQKPCVKKVQKMLTITEPCSNREFQRVELKNFHIPTFFRISSWSYDMEGHAKKCVDDIVSWPTRRLNNSTKYQLHACIDDHHFKEEQLKSEGELSKVCSQIFLKCLYLARIGRPDILWSVNKLARSITKWTKACDKRLNRFISYIHYTREKKSIVMWVILQNNAGWDCFKTPILGEILRTQNILQEGSCVFLEVTCLCQ